MSKPSIDKGSKIYIAGHRGLVGSALWRVFTQAGYTNLIGRSHSELDLEDAVAVQNFFEAERPEYVILAAAYVGGIMANNTRRADFIFRNLAIQQNVIGESFRCGVKKLLFLGSTCIYPREAEQPIREEALLTAPLEYTNEPYAIAKIAGLKMCESFNLQYGTNFIACMPTNLYGYRDNFDLDTSHVLPAIVRRMHLAKLLADGDFMGVRQDLALRPLKHLPNASELSDEALAVCLAEQYGIGASEVVLWGSGQPRREFLWSEDMAQACRYLLEYVDFTDLAPQAGEVRNCHINIGTGEDIPISELAQLIQQEVGYQGKIVYDRSKPDGTMRKLTDPTRLHKLGWHHQVELGDGIHRLYRHYLSEQSPLLNP